MNYDFSGYATKYGIVCNSDNRIIHYDAFSQQDKQTVPLVWQHLHNEPTNVLGHAVLEKKKDGIYCYGTFNDTEHAKHAKQLVKHGDINSLSIHANRLVQEGNVVKHGIIREVSLVLSGSNPGALIDNVSISHSDGTVYTDQEEAIIYSGEDLNIELEHQIKKDGGVEMDYNEIFNSMTEEQQEAVVDMIDYAENNSIFHADDETTKSNKTVGEVFDSLTEEQKQAVYFLIGTAIEEGEGSKKGSKKDSKKEGGEDVKHNLFSDSDDSYKGTAITDDMRKSVISDAKRFGSMKESVLAHSAEYGFDNVDYLFPDAKDPNDEIAVIKRKSEWAKKVLSDTNHSPFSIIKTRIANLTLDQARAKGYVKGNLKKDQVIPLMRRKTTPTTIYKKQRMDRDDMIDIKDFDVVRFLKAEMRELLDEELARAILISDGRDVGSEDEDKINTDNIRPIAFDDDILFIERVVIETDTDVDKIIDDIIRNRKHYKGSGTPDLFISTDLLTEMLLLKDKFGHRLYKTEQELASVLRVKEIVEVEPMNDATRPVGDFKRKILAIMVNLSDYTIGCSKGGEVNFFDDFDIDYNQMKYLIETRASGALTQPKSAVVIEEKDPEEEKEEETEI